MGFNRKEVSELLVKCHRRCCICHRFCGTKIETDHIELAAESNDHRIENAIPVCFDCHAEIHAYNPKHPRGRKFTSDELKGHKENWLKICKEKPEALIHASRDVDSGPIQGMLDELEHNLVISENVSGYTLGFLFRDEQLSRAIREGVMSILDDDLRARLSHAYGVISSANEAVRRIAHVHEGHVADLRRETVGKVKESIPTIRQARDSLREFLKSADLNEDEIEFE